MGFEIWILRVGLWLGLILSLWFVSWEWVCGWFGFGLGLKFGFIDFGFGLIFVYGLGLGWV